MEPSFIITRLLFSSESTRFSPEGQLRVEPHSVLCALRVGKLGDSGPMGILGQGLSGPRGFLGQSGLERVAQ